MKERAKPREVPDLPHYLRVQVDTNGEHVFRIPSQATALEEVTKARDVVKEEDPALLRARMLLPAGSYIGELWWHPTMDLESVRGRKSPEDYGRAIHEELHEAGYQAAEITYLVKEVGTAISMQAMARDEIDGRKAFFAPTGAGGIASDTDVPESGAETSANGEA